MVRRLQKAVPMNDELSTPGGGGWAVAGILTALEGAVLTSSVGDGGLAGTIELMQPVVAASNDAQYGHREEELG